MTPCAVCDVNTSAEDCACAHEPVLMLPRETLTAMAVAKLRGDHAEVTRLKLDGLARLRAVRHDTYQEDSMTRTPHSMFIKPAHRELLEGADRRDATPPMPPSVDPFAAARYQPPPDDSEQAATREVYRRRQYCQQEAFSLVAMDNRRAGINLLPQPAEIDRAIDAIIAAGGPRGYTSADTANNAGMNRSGMASL